MIKINNLTFFYNNSHPILNGISTQIEKGKVIGLLGKNGTGKTTLLYLLAGLLEPKSGTMEVNGLKPFDRHPSFLNDIYFIPETISSVDISIHNYQKANAWFYPLFDKHKFERLLDKHQLNEKSRISDLSTGQLKQMILSFALSTNVRLLLLDEPTNGLDIPSKDAFKKLIASETTEEQTVIISTHQAKDIELLIDHIIILKDNSIALNLSVAEILEKYNFDQNSKVKENELIFSKSFLGDNKVILHHQGYDTNLVLELLFYAVNEGVQL